MAEKKKKKRYNQGDWRALELTFYKWCKERNEVNAKAFFEEKRLPFSFGRFRQEASKWRDLAQEHVDRQNIGKAKKKLEEVKKEIKQANQVIVLSGRGGTERPEEATKIINECMQDGLKGFENGSKIFLYMSNITRKQLERIDKQADDEGITMEEANAISTLVGATEKALKIFKQVAVVDSEQVKALVTLDEQYKLRAIEHKAIAMNKAKETDNQKDQTDLYGKLKSYAKEKHGVEIN